MSDSAVLLSHLGTKMVSAVVGDERQKDVPASATVSGEEESPEKANFIGLF